MTDANNLTDTRTFFIRVIPAKVSTPTTTPGDGFVTLSWTDPGDTGITHWYLDVVPNPRRDVSELARITPSESGNNLTYKAMQTSTSPSVAFENGLTYRFRLRARAGEEFATHSLSDPSDSVWVAPRASASAPVFANPSFEPLELTVGTQESRSLPTATGGDGSFSYTLTPPTGESLPVPFRGTASPPALAGRPTRSQQFVGPYVYTATDGTGATARGMFNMGVRPAKPPRPRVTAGAGQVVLSWDKPGDEGITGWQLLSGSSPPPGGSTITVITPTESGNELSYVVTGLADEGIYYFSLQARAGPVDPTVSEPSPWDGAVCSSGMCDPFQTVPDALTVPGAPTGLSASAGNGQVVLSWTAGGDGGSAVTKHQVRQKADGGSFGNWTDIPDSAPGGANASRYTVTELTNGTPYTFQVRAVNTLGGGAASNEASATPAESATPETVPAAPDKPVLKPGDGKLAASWTEPADDGGSPITGYELEWTEATDPAFAHPLGSAMPTGASHTIGGLENGVEYAVRVRAINAIGPGPWSESATATPVAAVKEELYRQVSQTVLPRVARVMVDGTLSTVAERVAGMGAVDGSGSVSVTLGGYAVRPAAESGSRGFGWRPASGGDVFGPATGYGWGWRSSPADPFAGKMRYDSMDARQFLAGTSFLAQAGDEGAPSGLALWGGGRWHSLSGGDDDGVDWSGEIWGLRLGADARPHPQWLTGVALDWSQGSFDWSSTDPAYEPGRTGRYELSMTGVHPYVGWMSTDRAWRLWGLVGYGAGRVELSEDGTDGDAQKSDLSMRAAAVGASRELWRSADVIAGGETALRGKGEASAVEVDLEGNAGAGGQLDPLTVEAQRLRLALEARHERDLPGGGRLVPSLEVGARSDLGDGEAGSALEVGAGLRWVDADLGLVLDGRGHVLAVSEDGAGEWGVALLLHYDPGIPRRDLVFNLSTGYGASEWGAGRLWGQDAAALSSAGRFEPQARFDAELGYGFAVPGVAGLLTAYTGLSLSGEEDRRYRLGGRWTFGERLHLTLEGEHDQSLARPENRISLTGRVSF